MRSERYALNTESRIGRAVVIGATILGAAELVAEIVSPGLSHLLEELFWADFGTAAVGGLVYVHGCARQNVAQE